MFLHCPYCQCAEIHLGQPGPRGVKCLRPSAEAKRVGYYIELTPEPVPPALRAFAGRNVRLQHDADDELVPIEDAQPATPRPVAEIVRRAKAEPPARPAWLARPVAAVTIPRSTPVRDADHRWDTGEASKPKGRPPGRAPGYVVSDAEREQRRNEARRAWDRRKKERAAENAPAGSAPALAMSKD
jgi:hypothetical protein